MKRTLARLAATGLVMGAAGPAFADTRVVTEERTEVTLPGQTNDETTEVTLWFRSDRAARINDALHMISRFDRKEAYILDPGSESYSVLPIDAGQMEDSGAVEVARTGENKTIGSWEAEKYVVTWGTGDERASATLWMSDDVGVDLEAYRTYAKSTAELSGAQWMEAIFGLDGYPVLMEVEMGVVKVTTKLLSASEETPPPGTYEPPPDWQRRE